MEGPQARFWRVERLKLGLSFRFGEKSNLVGDPWRPFRCEERDEERILHLTSVVAFPKREIAAQTETLYGTNLLAEHIGTDRSNVVEKIELNPDRFSELDFSTKVLWNRQFCAFGKCTGLRSRRA